MIQTLIDIDSSTSTRHHPTNGKVVLWVHMLLRLVKLFENSMERWIDVETAWYGIAR